MTENPYISIVIPIYNEEDDIERAVANVETAMMGTGITYEIIFVNDGSRDRSPEILDRVASEKKSIRVIHFRRNFGQTAAMSAGFDHARGEIIVPMDGDNQNDPRDIPNLLAKIDEGYDVVSGWRKNRQDKGLTRKLPSRIANRLISKISGVSLHDYGCTLKAYRKEVLEGVRLYGEMHRFIPIYASWQGGKVAELAVNHHPRKFGTSKYGLSSTFKVILDLILIKFMATYSRSPIRLFGGFGLLSFALGFLAFGWAIYYKLWGDKSFIETPLPLMSVTFFFVGVLAIFIGLLAEMIMRTYHESQNKSTYVIRAFKNFE